MELYVMRGNESLGRFSTTAIQSFLEAGQLLSTDIGSVDGEEWKPLGNILPNQRADKPSADIGLKHRIRRATRAAHEFLQVRMKPRVVLAITVLLLLISWIYPPWIHYGHQRRDRPAVHRGWFFVFDTTQSESDGDDITMTVDVGRLLLLDCTVLVAGVMTAYAVSRRSVRSTVSALVMATACTLIAGAVIYSGIKGVLTLRHIADERRAEAEKRAAFERLRTIMANLPDVPTVRELAKAIMEALKDGHSERATYCALAERFNGFMPVKELNGLGYKIGPRDGFTLKGLGEAMVKDVRREQSKAAAISPSTTATPTHQMTAEEFLQYALGNPTSPPK